MSLIKALWVTAVAAVGASALVPVPQTPELPGYTDKLVHLGCYLCLLYTSPSPRDKRQSRMPSSA